jgi:hypothetical protein
MSTDGIVHTGGRAWTFTRTLQSSCMRTSAILRPQRAGGSFRCLPAAGGMPVSRKPAAVPAVVRCALPLAPPSSRIDGGAVLRAASLHAQLHAPRVVAVPFEIHVHMPSLLGP